MRRSRLEMYASILNSVREWKGITRMVQDAQLNYSHACKELKRLEALAFVEKRRVTLPLKSGTPRRNALTNKPRSKVRHEWKATNKGLIFLQKIVEAKALLKESLEYKPCSVK